MFEYSCTATHQANWVFSQVTDQPGAVFPKRKGWSFYIRAFYPGGSETSMLMALVANNSECIVFMPVDDDIDESRIIAALKPDILTSLRRNFKQVSYQTILITSERQQPRVLRLLDQKLLKSDLLVLFSDRIAFGRGNFNNPRLEFRLSQQNYDPDLIPGFFHDSRLRGLETIQKSQYYQNLFHRLNHHWLTNVTRVSLKQLVGESLPCWGQYRRADQKKIFQQVQAELEPAFRHCFEGLISLETYRKKPGSQPEEIIQLPDPPDSKKTVASWNRRQKQAIEFLNESRKPLTIEELELFID